MTYFRHWQLEIYHRQLEIKMNNNIYNFYIHLISINYCVSAIFIHRHSYLFNHILSFIVCCQFMFSSCCCQFIIITYFYADFKCIKTKILWNKLSKEVANHIIPYKLYSLYTHEYHISFPI